METSYEILLTPGCVDSPLKLHLLLVFLHHPTITGDVEKLNRWLHAPPWDVENALEELVEVGLLIYDFDADGRNYRLPIHTKYRPVLSSLSICYNDPFQRDTIYATVREVYQEQQFQAWLGGQYSGDVFTTLAERFIG